MVFVETAVKTLLDSAARAIFAIVVVACLVVKPRTGAEKVPQCFGLLESSVFRRAVFEVQKAEMRAERHAQSLQKE
eukprot:3411499-Amphidinium_carterae.1